jgi:hypothetical protein
MYRIQLAVYLCAVLVACNVHDPDDVRASPPPGTPVPPSVERRASPTAFDPFANGWVEWASASLGGGNWFQQMVATWTVPAAPAGSYTASPPMHFAVWPGLEPMTNDVVVQPVLFYGYGPAGSGGTRWNLACYVTDRAHNFTNSPILAVNPGDTLTTNMFATNCTASGVCQWTCTASDLSTGQSTTLSAQPINEPLNLAYGGVIEALGLDLGTCLDYPVNGPSVISNIALYDRSGAQVTPSWDPVRFLTGCGFGVSSAPDSTTLDYTGWVCTPGTEQSCCAYPQGCSCRGDRACSPGGTWSACIDSSPLGSPCR